MWKKDGENTKKIEEKLINDVKPKERKAKDENVEIINPPEDKNNDYYIMMAKAWLISTCYIKFKDKTIKFLKNTKIDDITYNKAISKICDSLRVSKDEKSILKNMKKMSKNA